MQDVTSTVNWSSSASSVATINTAGLAIGAGTGPTTISAAFGTISGSTTLTGTPAPTLASIAVSPQNPSVTVGAHQQFTAMPTSPDETTQTLTPPVTWPPP